jgi:hypothetical protein
MMDGIIWADFPRTGAVCGGSCTMVVEENA